MACITQSPFKVEQKSTLHILQYIAYKIKCILSSLSKSPQWKIMQ